VVVGFAASVAHAPDMGGRTGSSESRDVFEEGFQIPPMYMCKEGVADATFFKLLAANVREPDEVIGDLWAQVSALELIEKRVVALMHDAGLTSLSELAREIHDRSERAMRKAILALPDGTYRYETQTDGMAEAIRIKIAVTVKDDTIVVDYAGTSPQVDRALNSALCYTQAYTMYGLKCLLSPEVPNNAGSFRPIEIRAPEGSLVNHTFPNSGCSRALVGHYLPFLVLAALAPAVPDRVIAGSGSPVWSVLMRGVDQRNRSFADKYFYNGGMGAGSARPGMSALSWPTNLSITQTEVVEHSVPCEIRYRRLRAGSGGIGRNPGGMGQDVLFESVSDKPMLLIFMAERTRIPAPGLQGGGDGGVGELQMDGKRVDPKVQHVLAPGASVLLRTPGGGGFGSPGTADGQGS
jgi:N-methylhydantoinase B